MKIGKIIVLLGIWTAVTIISLNTELGYWALIIAGIISFFAIIEDED